MFDSQLYGSGERKENKEYKYPSLYDQKQNKKHSSSFKALKFKSKKNEWIILDVLIFGEDSVE